MMIKPGISELSKCADSRYTLVTMAAKRARMIGENGVGMVKCESLKPVSMAINEIAAGKVGYVRNSSVEEYKPAEEWRPDQLAGDHEPAADDKDQSRSGSGETELL